MSADRILMICVTSYVVIAWVVAFCFGLTKSRGHIGDTEMLCVVFWPFALLMLCLVILTDLLVTAWRNMPKRDTIAMWIGYLLLPLRPYALGQLVCRFTLRRKGIKT
jgi:hypothetical protein